MLPGKERLITCPYCGQEKGVMTLLSYNTFGAVQWSDTKTEMEFNINVSPVQKCLKCGKYYFEYNQEGREGNIETLELGTLNYPESVEAINQLLSEDSDYVERKMLYIVFLHAYNDWFVRYNENNEHIETEKDLNLFNKYISEGLLIDALNSNIKIDPIFIGELMRESGKFDDCLDFCDNLKDIFKDNSRFLGIVGQIIDYAKKGDKKVFPIQ